MSYELTDVHDPEDDESYQQGDQPSDKHAFKLVLLLLHPPPPNDQERHQNQGPVIVREPPVAAQKLQLARRGVYKVNGVGVKTDETDGVETEESEARRERVV